MKNNILIRGCIVFFIGYLCFGSLLASDPLESRIDRFIIQNTIVFPLYNSSSLKKLVIPVTSRVGFFFSNTEKLKDSFLQSHIPILLSGIDYCLCPLCEKSVQEDFSQKQWEGHSREILIS